MKATTRNRTAMHERSGISAGRVAAALVLVLALGACKSHGKRGVAAWILSDPAQNHPIIVDRKEVVLDISVPPGSYGLTHNQKADLRAFAMRFNSEDSGGVLVIRAPSGGPNEIAAMRAMESVRRVIRGAGVAQSEVAFESYASGGIPAAPIRISYLRHVAQAPVCGEWSTDLARDPQNLPYPNLGCASQANLAAMVDNPRDFLEPRGMTPRSGERRDTIWDKYIKGETTIADKAEEEKTSVSEVKGGGN